MEKFCQKNRHNALYFVANFFAQGVHQRREIDFLNFRILWATPVISRTFRIFRKIEKMASRQMKLHPNFIKICHRVEGIVTVFLTKFFHMVIRQISRKIDFWGPKWNFHSAQFQNFQISMVAIRAQIDAHRAQRCELVCF